MNFTFFNVLILIGCIQGFLLTFLLARGTKFKKKSNAYLALFIFSFSRNNLYYFAFDISFFERDPLIYFLPFTRGLLMPFAFFYFVEILLTPECKPATRISFWMILPFCLHVFVQFLSFGIYIINLPFLAKHIRLYNSISHITELFNMLFAIVVLVWILVKINCYQAKLKDNFSSIENRALAWLRNLIVALFFLWGLWCIPYV